jgi:hypothetical protein
MTFLHRIALVKTAEETLVKGNENHGPDGNFSSGSGGGLTSKDVTAKVTDANPNPVETHRSYDGDGKRVGDVSKLPSGKWMASHDKTGSMATQLPSKEDAQSKLASIHEKFVAAGSDPEKYWSVKKGEPMNNGGETAAASSQDTTSGAGGQNNSGAQVSGADMRSQMTMKDPKDNPHVNEMQDKKTGKTVGHVVAMPAGGFAAHHLPTGKVTGSYPQKEQAASAVAEAQAGYNNSGGNSANEDNTNQ